MATERASSSSIPALTSPSPGASRRSGELRSAGRKCLSGLPAWSGLGWSLTQIEAFESSNPPQQWRCTCWRDFFSQRIGARNWTTAIARSCASGAAAII